MSRVLHRFTYDGNEFLCYVPSLDFDLLNGMGIMAAVYGGDEEFLVRACLNEKQHAYVTLRYTAEKSGAVLLEHAKRASPFYLAERLSNTSNDWNTGSVIHE